MTLIVRFGFAGGTASAPDDDGLVSVNVPLSGAQSTGKGTIAITGSIAEDLRLKVNDPLDSLLETIDGEINGGQWVFYWDGSVDPVTEIYFQIITTDVISTGSGFDLQITVSSLE